MRPRRSERTVPIEASAPVAPASGDLRHRDPRHGAPLRRWGRFVGRHAKAFVLAWLVFIVAGFAVADGGLGTDALFDRLHSGEVTSPGEARTGRDLLAQAGVTGFATYTLVVDGVDLSSGTVAQAATLAARDIAAIDQVTQVVNPFVVPGGPGSAQGLALVADGTAASGGFATVVSFDPADTADQEKAATAQVDVVFDRLVTATHATSSQRGGVRTLVDAIVGQIPKDLRTGEGIALPVSFLVMVIVFGGFLAAGLPIVGAIASIAGALASLLGFSYLLDLDATSVNVVTVLGLGLSIDYGLLTVSRFREELRAERHRAGLRAVTRDQVLLATERTVDRAGRTVIFSALTVAISLAGLMAFDVDFMRAISAAAVSVVVVALAVSLSLIPALATLSARRLLRRGAETTADEGVFSRLAERVHAHPWVVIIGVVAVLGVAAWPAQHLRITSSGAQLLPVGTPQRTYVTTINQHFPRLGGPPVTIVTRAPLAQVEAYAATARTLPGVVSTDPAQQVPGSDLVTLGLRTGDTGLGQGSRDAVAALHLHRPPFAAYVVGQASQLHDLTHAMIGRAPLALGLVALATLVLLFLMTGSVVIPVKALVMNVVSLSAAMGLLVWIFQEGHLEGPLGFASVGAVESTIPLLVLAFGFGLSMDYEVFLLSRVVELHEQGHDSQRSVTLGLQRSGRIITSAALLVVIVFSGFAAGKLLAIKEMGVALLLAIVIDATLVRMLLVPATMSVLGNANWWAPRSLRRLHRRWGITE
jgi:RND superfamily putative drug exporter